MAVFMLSLSEADRAMENEAVNGVRFIPVASEIFKWSSYS